MQRLRYAPVPVVTAPFGLTLGGGAELAMHGAAARAHAELYMGLVEVGVGLIPGGGGCKELLARALGALPRRTSIRFPFVKQIFMTIAHGARSSTRAEEARAIGMLARADGVSLNRDHLLADAKQTRARPGARRLSRRRAGAPSACPGESGLRDPAHRRCR